MKATEIGSFHAKTHLSELLEKVMSRAAKQVECWLSDGLAKAMNQFNGVVDSTNEAK